MPIEEKSDFYGGIFVKAIVNGKLVFPDHIQENGVIFGDVAIGA